ncbi:hypothetical protein QFZ48_003643 [Chitinophaga sp. W2I13]
MVGISGANPNQPKKQTKNMSHVIWNVRICMVSRLNIFNFSKGAAMCCVFTGYLIRNSGRIFTDMYAQLLFGAAFFTFLTVGEDRVAVLQK